MESVIFASFERPAEAFAAVRHLRRQFLGDDGVRVKMRARDEPSSELDVIETHARTGLGIGALSGGLAGLAAGILITGATDWAGHSTTFTVIFCAFLGLAIGLLAGALVAPINPDRGLERIGNLTPTQGAIVTVESDATETQKEAATILRQYTQAIEYKPTVAQEKLDG